MFLKPIDKKTALELACKGHEVKVLVPAAGNDWEDMRIHESTVCRVIRG